MKHLSEAGNARSGFFTEIEIRSVISHLAEYSQDLILSICISDMRKGEVPCLRCHDLHGDAITLRAENPGFQCENRRTHLNDDCCIATPLNGHMAGLVFNSL